MSIESAVERVVENVAALESALPPVLEEHKMVLYGVVGLLAAFMALSLLRSVSRLVHSAALVGFVLWGLVRGVVSTAGLSLAPVKQTLRWLVGRRSDRRRKRRDGSPAPDFWDGGDANVDCIDP